MSCINCDYSHEGDNYVAEKEGHLYSVDWTVGLDSQKAPSNLVAALK